MQKMTDNANRPAYPLVINHETHQPFDGLTKREYFAAMAMQGLLASCAGEHEYPIADKIARAVEMADALLSELEKPTQP
jgi:hypothetical protein